jgi:hypothetical protein
MGFEGQTNMRTAFAFLLLLGLISCGTENHSNNPALPAGQWEFAVNPVNAPTFYMEVNFASSDASVVNTSSVFVSRTAVPGNPDLCNFDSANLQFEFDMPTASAFNYSLTTSSNGTVANGVGTFTESSAEATYLSTASGLNPPCTIRSDSGGIQGSPVKPFSGSWIGDVGGDAQLSFMAGTGSEIEATGLFGNTTIASSCVQTGATVSCAVPNFSSLGLREVANTTDGYPAGKSGPAIYVWLQNLGTGGVLIPSQ